MTTIKIVIGANFGDEGKGMMTDFFCTNAQEEEKRCIVVCCNGGSQRGHTVVTPEGIRHVFHHFGSGTFVGADTYLSEEYIINPMLFRKEYEELQKLGCKPMVYMNENCRWSTPFDMILNQIAEEKRGAKRHGSCGIGIWETIVRYKTKRWSLKDVLEKTEEELKRLLKEIKKNYLPRRLKELGIKKISGEWKEIIESDGLIENYIQDFRFLFQHAELVNDEILKSYPYIVFENGQGLLLDQNIKEFKKHTTPSNTGLKNPEKIIKNVFEKDETDVEVCYITRTYLTRHGAGPLNTECDMKAINPYMMDQTNVPNPHQGTLRYGKLEQMELQKRILKDFGKNQTWMLALAVTHVNEYSFVPESTAVYKKIYISDGETREGMKVYR